MMNLLMPRVKIKYMQEQRKNIRVDGPVKISYRVISPPDGWGDSVTINISKGGIALPADHTLLPGVVLELKIDLLNNTEPINATAEVVWVNKKTNTVMPYIIGLKFLNINLRDRDRIYYYISKKSEEKHKNNMKWIE